MSISKKFNLEKIKITYIARKIDHFSLIVNIFVLLPSIGLNHELEGIFDALS